MCVCVCVCVWWVEHKRKEECESESACLRCALYKLGVYLAFDPRVQECDWSLLGYGEALQLLLVLTLLSPESMVEHTWASKMFHKIVFLLCNTNICILFCNIIFNFIKYFILFNYFILQWNKHIFIICFILMCLLNDKMLVLFGNISI